MNEAGRSQRKSPRPHNFSSHSTPAATFARGLEKNRGFKEHELNQIARLVEDHQTVLLDAWHDYFDT
jgi:hypothetical protein